MPMIKWDRPGSTPIETNDCKATIEQCELLGWKRAGCDDIEKEAAVIKYKLLFGKAPHHKSGLDKILSDIAAKEAESDD